MPDPKSKLGKSIASKGKSVTDKLDAPSIPWKGPEGEGPQGGVTQGLLGRFLLCRKRFYVRVYEGLTARDTFQAPIEYGNFWHAAEEAYKMDPKKSNAWLEAILKYLDELYAKYPMDREAITHWYSLCREQFPIYIDFWGDELQEKNRQRIMSEQVFDVPYKLPYSGRTVRLRGKWDGVSLCEDNPGEKIPGGKLQVAHGFSNKGIWLDENKTKSGIDHVSLTRQLKFDLQTMLYLITLKEYQISPKQYRLGGEGIPRGTEIKGVRYNVVKRSAHKSPDSMMRKIQEDIDSGRGAEWFARWYTEISDADIEAFKRDCLDPALEQLCIWWDVLNGEKLSVESCFLQVTQTARLPYGIYNPLDRGGEDAVDEYLNTGNRSTLQRVTNLFPELQE